MREHKRVLNEFKWTRSEKKEPVFYVIRKGEELYFVNDSTETLNSVLYKNVKPGEAVKVEHYDPYWDSDYLLQLEVELSSPTHGNKIFRVLGKGGIDDTVLLWDTGEAGKYVNME
jgi:hypothetical protein